VTKCVPLITFAAVAQQLAERGWRPFAGSQATKVPAMPGWSGLIRQRCKKPIFYRAFCYLTWPQRNGKLTSFPGDHGRGALGPLGGQEEGIAWKTHDRRSLRRSEGARNDIGRPRYRAPGIIGFERAKGGYDLAIFILRAHSCATCLLIAVPASQLNFRSQITQR
jgi:hypothetical protein